MQNRSFRRRPRRLESFAPSTSAAPVPPKQETSSGSVVRPLPTPPAEDRARRDAPRPPREPAATPRANVASIAPRPAAAPAALAVEGEFATLGLAAPLLRAVLDAGHARPTSIQARAIPHALAGRDVVGLAQTGTGKTAAFVLPILERLFATKERARPGRPLALVLSPTRELASQIAESVERYGRHASVRCAVIFGGVGASKQIAALRAGVDVLVATPGRLEDLMGERHVALDAVRFFVLDEADRMLDPGFLPHVRRVVRALPAARQTMLFSATMPKELEPLVASVLRDPVRVEAAAVASTPDRIDQSLYFVERDAKRDLLADLLKGADVERAIVFTRTKHGADRVVKQLAARGVEAAAIHGNKSQNARERALSGFRDGSLPILVATDIAARGIDVSGVSHVVNYDLPDDPESYVHRIGRTARAGAVGTAIALCASEERPLLARVERLTRQRIPVVTGHAYEGVANSPRRDLEDAPRSGQPRGGQPPRGGFGRRPRRR